MSRIRLALWVGAVLSLIAFVISLQVHDRTPGPGTVRTTQTGAAELGGPFTLTAQDGRRVSSAEFAGKWQLLYFGFTYCPDVCPTELNRMAAVLEALGPRAQKVQPLFITVDPERDTPEVMAAYVRHFGDRLIGLTGTPEEIAAVLAAYRVYARKAEIESSSVGYLVDHSSVLYLMTPDGRFDTFFTAADAVEDITEALEKRL
ncbi:MAG: SCO family protein [Alphaproteobacteria bacterium]|nr:SCO family protein [Alphaproteobacteria bacterium]